MKPCSAHGKAVVLATAALVCLAAVFAYMPALNAGFIWDDDDNVTRNFTLLSTEGLRLLWTEPESNPQQYYPIVHTTFWLEHAMAGFNPVVFHATNLFLHLLNGLFWWRLLKRLGVPCAGFAATVFILHPVQVESVAWITERKNVLSLLFYLASAHFFVSWFRLGHNRSEQRHETVMAYLFGLFFFVCALLSKTVTASLPAALLLAIWWKRGRIAIHEVLATTPLFLGGFLAALNTKAMEEQFVGATGSEWAFSFVERCLIAGRGLWHYAWSIVWPSDLIFIYPRWNIDASSPGQYLFVAAAAAVPIALWLLRKRIGRGPLVAVLFFAGTLVPALGFFNVYAMLFSFVADHFQYHADMGIMALATACFCAASTSITSRFSGSVKHSLKTGAGRTLMLILSATLAVLTWRQCRIYESVDTLWTDTLARNPSCWMAHINYGAHLAARGQNTEAVSHLREAIRLKPDYPYGYINLGNVQRDCGMTDEALESFRLATVASPDCAEAHYNMATLYLGKGNTEKAIDHLDSALEANPDSPSVLNNMAVALTRLGQLSRARALLAHAIQLNPASTEVLINMANVLELQGHRAEAAEYLMHALSIDPQDATAHNNIGILYAESGRIDEAIAHFEMAVHIDPSFKDAQTNLQRARETQSAIH